MADNTNDMSNVGQDKQYKQPTEKYDADHGKYNDPIDGQRGTDEGNMFPLDALPMAPAPNPFKLGK